jgi:phage portal protein BeeE
MKILNNNGVLDKAFSRLFAKFGYMKESDVGKIIGSYMTNVYGLPLLPEKNYAQLVDAYKSWVYTCIDKIGKSVAMIPLKLYVYRKKGTNTKVTDMSWRQDYKCADKREKRYILKQLDYEREEITDHIFLDLIRKPNSFMTRFMLWYESMIRLELGGFCGWYIPPNKLGLPSEIWPLPLTKNAIIRPKVSSDLQLEYWDYQDGDVRRQFPPNDVLPIKYPNPASPFHSMSPLMAQTYPYDIDLFLMQQQRGLLANMAVPGLHLTTDQKLVKDQIDELKALIEEQYVGPTRTGKTLITHSGLKAEKLGQTGREMVIQEVARGAREKLITSYDLSEGKLGLVRDVNRANMEALNETFINECLRPKCMMIEEILEVFLLPRYDDGLTCDFELPDFEDKQFKLAERKQNLDTAFTSINEERMAEGKEPVEWGDMPFVPFGSVQWGTPPPAPPTPPPSSSEDDKDKEKEKEKEKEKDGKSLNPDYWNEDRKEIAWKQFNQDVDKYIPLVLDPLKAYFNQQREFVIARLHEEGRKIQGLYAGWSKAKAEAHIAKNNSLDKINIEKTAEKQRLKQLFLPLVKSIMLQAGEARLARIYELTRGRFGYNVNDPKTLKWLGERMELFSDQVSGTTFNEIEAILRDGFNEGLPVASIADMLREKFDSWDEYRAPLIAQTETISAMNMADLLSVEQSGLDEQLLKCWLSARDSHVRESHQQADKNYSGGIPIDEMFQIDGDEMLAPGSGQLAEENINCRCTLIYVEK